LKESFKKGLETGDFEYAGFCALFSSYHSYLAGNPLDEVAEETEECSGVISQLKHETSQYMIDIYRQAVSNLTGKSGRTTLLVGDAYDEIRLLPRHEQAKDRTTLYSLYFNKTILSYLFGEYQDAVSHADRARKYIDGVVGMYVIPVFYFFESLSRLAVYADSSKPDQRKILKAVSENQKKLKFWAGESPENHMHRYRLVQAEWMSALGKDGQAQDFYDEAIERAKQNRFIHEAAIAQELAAKHYLKRERRSVSKAYLQEARYSYMKWGADSKVKDIENRHGQLLAGSSIGEIGDLKLYLENIEQASEYSSSERVDLSSVVKASQAISSEIILSKLLYQLIKIVVENAGAQKGFLILENGGKLYVEAEGSMELERVTLHQSIPIETCEKLSSAVVNYVARTRERVVLSDALKEGLFTHDPYLVSIGAKSVLCEPIIQKSRLLGMFYLENNLMPGAFNLQRLQVLKLLSSQIAISLENARLYSTLEDSELRYRELYENLVDMVVLVSPDGTILMANPRFYSTIGMVYRKELAIPFRRWVHPDDLSNVEESLLGKIHERKIIRDFQFRMVNKSGKEFEVECNAKCIERKDETVGHQIVIRDVTERKRLEKELIDSLHDVQNARAGTILGLAKLAEYRDEDTGAHLERIREYAKIIAEELAQTPKYKSYITPEYIGDLYFSSILHDIGKVGIPDSILLKPSRLTEDEFEIIKQHTVIGGDILRQVNSKVEGQSFLNVAMHIAYYHHEKWNGKGYPKGLKEEEIPLSARIVALVDVYDALTSKRIYKDAFSHEKAKEIILKERGEHFDPDIVDAFLVHESDFNRIREKMHVADEDNMLMRKLRYRSA
jgi:PAS domain S-box-containing protein